MGNSFDGAAAAAEIAEVLAKHRVSHNFIDDVLADAKQISGSVPCLGKEDRAAAWNRLVSGKRPTGMDAWNDTPQKFRSVDGKVNLSYGSPDIRVSEKLDIESVSRELSDTLEKELRNRMRERGWTQHGKDMIPPIGAPREVFPVVANDGFDLSERHYILGIFDSEGEAETFRSIVEKNRPECRPSILKEIMNDPGDPASD